MTSDDEIQPATAELKAELKAAREQLRKVNEANRNERQREKVKLARLAEEVQQARDSGGGE